MKNDLEKLLLAGLGAIKDIRERIEEVSSGKESRKDFCACGCGKGVPKGRKFLRGHNLNVVNIKRKKKAKKR